MKNELEAFIKRIPEFERVSMNNRELIAFFAFFLTEEMRDASISSKRIRECYETALLQAPINISDVIAKSKAFVKIKSGLQLQRSVHDQIANVLARKEESKLISVTATHVTAPILTTNKTNNVMVVHGRNRKVRDSMFDFLRAIKLSPIEWTEATKATSKGSPYVGEILNAAFNLAQVVVVLFTPDEHVELQRELCSGDAEFERESGYQARPNVFLEAGMALSKDEGRTLLVEVGDNRTASDLLGRHVIRLDDSAEKRNEFAQRLRTAGCEPDTSGQDWYSTGKFKIKIKKSG